MPTFKLKVQLTCKTCFNIFYSTIPDEIHIQPKIPNVLPTTFTIEELRDGTTKEIRDTSGNKLGTSSAEGLMLDITHNKCNTTNKYSINDCVFIPS